MVKRLSTDERAVLEHVHRYRLTMRGILARTQLVAEPGDTAAEAALNRLVREGFLSRADLYPGHRRDHYYHLSERGAEALGQDAEIARPLKPDQRVEAFAIATFCCCGDTFRELMTKEEFKKKFASLWFVGQPIRHYLDKGTDGVVRLAYLKVDKGGHGDWDRLIDSCARFLRQRMDKTRVQPVHRSKVDEFVRLVQRGQFQITVLTAFPEKQRAIELELARRKLAGEAVPPLRVHVVPGLFEVICPAPTK